MKILHILDHSLPKHSGYAFRSVAILAQQRRRGWQTVQLTTPKQGEVTSTQESVDGFEFQRTSYEPGLLSRVPGLWPLDEMRATQRRLHALASEVRPDLLHAHSPALTAWPAIRVGRALGIPVVYEVRAFWEDAAVDLGTTHEGSLRYRMTRALETQALRRVDAATTICEGLRGDIIARGIDPNRITVIPNAVDIERFPPIERRDEGLATSLGLSNAEVIGFCGSFYAYEGLELLVRALPGIRAQRPTARLLLVGGGPQEAMLRGLVTSLGIEREVVFTGRVPNAEIDRYYSLIDVLAYPRHSIRLTELVTPLKPLEAMAQKRLVVASDIGGHRELIQHERTGLLFAPGDVGALTASVVRLLGDGMLQQSLHEEGRRFVESERNWAASVARYAEVYENAMRRRPGGAAPPSQD